MSVDWHAAVVAAERRGGGFAPLRGYRRLAVRLLAQDHVPTPQVYDAALGYEVGQVARRVASTHREARLVLSGLRVVIKPGVVGHVLDQKAAAPVLVRALEGFSREPVALPVRADPPRVTVAALHPTAAVARRVLSAPVVATGGGVRKVLSRDLLAPMLALPVDAVHTVCASPAAWPTWSSRTCGA